MHNITIMQSFPAGWIFSFLEYRLHAHVNAGSERRTNSNKTQTQRLWSTWAKDHHVHIPLILHWPAHNICQFMTDDILYILYDTDLFVQRCFIIGLPCSIMQLIQNGPQRDAVSKSSSFRVFFPSPSLNKSHYSCPAVFSERDLLFLFVCLFVHLRVAYVKRERGHVLHLQNCVNFYKDDIWHPRRKDLT